MRVEKCDVFNVAISLVDIDVLFIDENARDFAYLPAHGRNRFLVKIVKRVLLFSIIIENHVPQLCDEFVSWLSELIQSEVDKIEVYRCTLRNPDLTFDRLFLFKRVCEDGSIVSDDVPVI